ncbi:hypothetical protein P3T37_001505 [Kitasatospora sp. MAA4]|uniref:DUF742 domain-containing protein n=1 Tax=Kitasatospora sp. MAA4 TaxID=3035093 RepID=UPI002473585C|nr:DUF742 domain-containing protein [Kitasatospora sp. MAA4]MDH6132120.1 hypothetical protein [Kitasatospora sp. MAA4]
MSAADPGWNDAEPERLYVITRGRSGLAETTFALVTLIVSRSEPTATMQPEHAAILRICGSPLSAAEISAYLKLPMSVVTVLLTDLLGEERIEARACVPQAILPDRALLEAVIHGLQKL